MRCGATHRAWWGKKRVKKEVWLAIDRTTRVLNKEIFILEEEGEKKQGNFGNHYDLCISNVQYRIVEKNKREVHHLKRFNHTLRQRISR